MPAIEKNGTDEATRLASVRFIQTRSIAGHERTLREIFTTPPTSGLGHELVGASLDAILATTSDRLSTAGFLAVVATGSGTPSTAMLAERALWALLPQSVEAVFGELTKPHAAKQRRSLVRLQMKLSDSRPPRPVKFWEAADKEARRQAVEEWRKAIATHRKP